MATEAEREKQGKVVHTTWPICDPEDRCEFIELKTWDEFCSKIRNRSIGLTLFRGQRDTYRIWSKWERLLYGAAPGDTHENKLRDAYLWRFREAVTGTPGFDGRSIGSERDWWAFARHYGLTTPLVDWTESPYIAAYFAYADAVEAEGLLDYTTLHPFPAYSTDKADEVVVIYALECQPVWLEEGPFTLFKPACDVMFRQKAQRGWFSWLADGVHIDIESYLLAIGMSGSLKGYSLPLSIFNGVLSDLKDMNIHAASLFPDPLGAARYANTDWAFRNGATFDPEHLKEIGQDQPYRVVSVPKERDWTSEALPR